MAAGFSYEDMVEAFGEQATKAAYARCLPFAEALVAGMCWPNEPADESEEEAYARAVMAACIADASSGCGHGLDGAESFTIGSFSMSGGAGGNSTLDAMRRAAAMQLTGTGLLYAGMGGTR